MKELVDAKQVAERDGIVAVTTSNDSSAPPMDDNVPSVEQICEFNCKSI